ncbi:MAG: tRNA (adenosine(37)-N6)-dimethylallyltransferase MiaA [Desulfomonilaceae bacterium]
MASKSKIVVLSGPTASGKTSLGIRLAQLYNGEIVSADSIQIYRYMDIGSAKPSTEEQCLVRHHMIDIRDPDEEYSVGSYVQEARSLVDSLIKKNKIPFIVGGTGLYIRGLLGGLIDLPLPDQTLRSKLKKIHEKQGLDVLFNRLKNVDIVSAERIGSRNANRIIRALEVYELTGKLMSDLTNRHLFRDNPYDTLFVCIAPKREVLYERIDKRVDNMLETGLLGEVIGLRNRGYTRELKSMQSLGYRHAAMILDGETDLSEAARQMKRDTRHYAKRQLTWFRSESNVTWFDPCNISAIEVFVENFLSRER